MTRTECRSDQVRRLAGHGEKRSRRQAVFLAALLQSPTVCDAAKLAGISVATAWRWAADPAFRDEYRKAAADALQVALGRLQAASGAAVGVLAAIMDDAGQPGAVRVAAAGRVLDTALRATELLDLAARVAALETAEQIGAE